MFSLNPKVAAGVCSVALLNLAIYAKAELPALDQQLQQYQKAIAPGADAAQFRQLMDQKVPTATSSKRAVKSKAGTAAEQAQSNYDERVQQAKNKVKQQIYRVKTDPKTGEQMVQPAFSFDGRRGEMDDFRDLVDNSQNPVTSLQDMEAKNLRSAKLADTPWSDDYWPIYKGILGNRFADPDFTVSEDFMQNLAYREANPISRTVSDGKEDVLSPSEKYSLLIGDSMDRLTENMWDEGRGYSNGGANPVETWMGICHGWAPAAFGEPRPTKMVTVTGAAGQPINFYPAEIKSLASYVWSKSLGNQETRFIGGRCNAKTAKKDPQSGAVIDDACFDVDPATWHKSVVNQIGVAKRSFVIDATWNYEVWNQPMYSYKYSYINPATMKASTTLTGATVKYDAAFKAKDKFANVRNLKPHSKPVAAVVGIAMDVSYVVEIAPNQEPVCSSEDDALKSARYIYDLELSADGEIIGGEWYSNDHPDFLWAPTPGAQALTYQDSQCKVTVGADGKPNFKACLTAAKSAADRGLVLSKIVKALIAESNK